MRYAIVSDVHGNLQAFNAVLTDIFSSAVDQIICLGDLVGYGPNPAEVLEAAYARVAHFAVGNHDAVIAGSLEPSAFNPRAARMIQWTARQVDSKAAGFLRQLPYALTDSLFRCTHGNPACPGAFTYILQDSDALEAWRACPEQILFVGHSHVPGLYVQGRSGTPHWLEPTDFATESHKRYIVNVGSVGQPRNGDVRASYCLLDSERGEVRFRQVPFDLDAYRQAVARSSAPAGSSPFLQIAAAGKPPPLRDMLDFHPLARGAARPCSNEATQLHKAVSSARFWRLGAVMLLLLLLGMAAAAWRLGKSPRPLYTEVAATEGGILPLPAVAVQCLAQPVVEGTIAPANPPRHWTVRLTDGHDQQVQVIRDEELDPPVIRLSSAAPAPMSLHAKPVAAAAGMRFKMLLRCRSDAAFQGHVAMSLVQDCADGTSRLIVHYPLENLRSDRWKYCHKSTPPEGLPQDGAVRWTLAGEFTGTLEVHSCGLERIQ